MRNILTFGMVILGFVLQIVSYFFLAAPIGTPANDVYSNPRMEFAPVLFIVGVGTVFLAAVVYELLPDKENV